MPIRVRVAGLGDIAPITVWGQTELESAAQGEASPGTVAVRDLGFTPTDFPLGARVEVDLGPDTRNIWGGYLLGRSRRAWFPADDPDKKHRLWVLSLMDNNVLFSKRVTQKIGSPSRVEGPIYTSTAYDDDVIATLVTQWLDLSTDGIDASTYVERVASIYYGDPVYPWNAAMTWGEAMDVISQLPAAVYGLDPDWNLIYGDVDDANAPFILHDVPGAGRVGYREATIWEDGTKLANDFAAWGAGKGANHLVFDRRIASASVAEHGLWQDTFKSYSIWKQGTIEKVTDSAVNGSPTSHRGRKNDVVRVDVVTHEHGLRIADRVRFVKSSESFDDVLPVRRIKIKPVTADEARYELVLSHDIDRWGFQNPPPPWSTPRTPIPDIPIDDGGGTADVPCEDIPCVTGITDAFGRSIAANNTDIGVSDAGPAWTVNDGGVGATLAVEPGSGLTFDVPAGETFGIEAVLPGLNVSDPEFDVLFRVKFNSFTPGEVARFDVNWPFFLRIRPGVTTASVQLDVGLDTLNRNMVWAPDTWYNIRVRSEDAKTTLALGIWTDFAVEDTAPALTGIDMTAISTDDFTIEARGQGDPAGFVVQFDDLLISGYESEDCTDRDACEGNCDCGLTDTFDDRTLTDSWGNPSSSGNPVGHGLAGSYNNPTGFQVLANVDGGVGQIGTKATTNSNPVAALQLTTGIQSNSVFSLPMDQVFDFHPTSTDDGPQVVRLRVGNARTLDLTIFPDASLIGPTVWDWSNTGVGIQGWNDTSSPTYWNMAGTSRIRYQVEETTPGNGVARVKIWDPNGPEPGAWAVEYEDELDGPTPFMWWQIILTIASLTSRPDSYVEIDNLLVTTNGRELSLCGEANFDNFNRFISGWGNATPSGETWVGGAGSGNSIFVGTTEGVMSLGVDSSLCGEAINVPVNTADGFECLILMKSNDFANMSVRGVTYQIFATAGDGAAYLELRIGALMTDSIRMTTGSGYVSEPMPTFVDDTYYWIRMHYDHTIGAARFWEYGQTEPSTWDIQVDSSGDTPTSGQHQLSILAGYAIGGAFDLYTGEISFTGYPGQPCYFDEDGNPVVSTGTVPGPTYGQLGFSTLDGKLRRISSTIFQLPVKFVAGTAQVFVDGTRQRPTTDGVTREYTEYPDDGRIVFEDPVDPADDVAVVVFGNGAV